MDKDIKFSVILPVYNVADCLEKCLDSLLEQTYKNFEIICVNDGSTDNSLEILEQYQDKFAHYQIITKKNQGLAQARNTGFPYAKGEYICYIDSDDFVVPEFFEEISKKTQDSPDIVIFGAKTYYSKSEKLRQGQYSSKNFKTEFDINKLYSFHPICWNKVYRRNFLIENNISFIDTRMAEDQPFFVQVILSAGKISVLKKDLYIYRKQRGTSLTGQKLKSDFAPINNFYYIEEILNKINADKNIKQKIISRNLLKAVSRYPKCSDKIKSEYFNKVKELLTHQKEKHEKGWWNYFEIKENNSYLSIKLEYLKAKIQSKFAKKNRK